MQGRVSINVQETNLEGSIPDGPEPIVLGRQAHWLPAQGLTQVNLLVPATRSRRGCVPAAPSSRSRTLGNAPGWDRGVATGSTAQLGAAGPGLHGVAPGCSWNERLEGSLLLQPVGLGRPGCPRLQRPVKPLQPPVLFRMSRLDTLWEDPQLDPPHGQGRQSPQSHAGKGRAVVGADGPGKAVLPEGPLQNRVHLRPPRLAQPVARQEIPGGGVLHGKGIDSQPIPRAKPALEVDAPQVVGLLPLDKGLAPRRRPAASLAPAHQPGPVQQVPSRAGSWPGDPRLTSLQPGYQFLGAPGRVRLPGRNQALRDRLPRFIGMPVGGPGSGLPIHPILRLGSAGPVYSRSCG